MTAGEAVRRPQPVLIDTDLGTDPDDALALVLAVASPEIDVVAVTVSGREVGLRVELTAQLLELAGRPDIPVHRGADAPIDPSGRYYWFGNERAGWRPDLDRSASADGVASEAIVRLARSVPGLHVVTLGALTNVAAALVREPRLPELVGRLVVMGGHFGRVQLAGGTLPLGFDYNLVADPSASTTVLGAGFDTWLVPIDQSFRVPLLATAIEHWRDGAPLLRHLHSLVEAWAPVQHDLLRTYVGPDADGIVDFLHDPLTLALYVAPRQCRWRRTTVAVSRSPRGLRTRLGHEADKNATLAEAPSVLTDIDPAALTAAILHRIERHAEGVTSSATSGTAR